MIMKNLLITLAILFSTNILLSQNKIEHYKWSDVTTFKLNNSPSITGYGSKSDSLSKAHNDSTFYVYNGEYYPIATWADYYRWYVKEYSYKFAEPQLYEYYYMSKNDYGMASFIAEAGKNNKRTNPQIAILFEGKEYDSDDYRKKNKALAKEYKKEKKKEARKYKIKKDNHKTDIKQNNYKTAKDNNYNKHTNNTNNNNVNFNSLPANKQPNSYKKTKVKSEIIK